MSEPSQKRALDNYRSRLKARGMARFEVLGLDQDRDLIRSLARQLGEGPDGGSQDHCRGTTKERRYSRHAASIPVGRHRYRSRPITGKRAKSRFVTIYLLDTTIVSDVVKPRPSPSLLEWLAAQADEDLFISSLTIAANDYVVVTANEKDFAGIDVVNPLRSAG